MAKTPAVITGNAKLLLTALASITLDSLGSEETKLVELIA